MPSASTWCDAIEFVRHYEAKSLPEFLEHVTRACATATMAAAQELTSAVNGGRGRSRIHECRVDLPFKLALSADLLHCVTASVLGAALFAKQQLPWCVLRMLCRLLALYVCRCLLSVELMSYQALFRMLSMQKGQTKGAFRPVTPASTYPSLACHVQTSKEERKGSSRHSRYP